jgi:CRP-like cAMP-binding protein
MVPTERLQSIPLFRGLEATALEELAEILELRKAPRGSVLFEAGNKRKECFIVLSGKVHIYRMFNEEVETLAVLDETNFAVESALVDPTIDHHHNAEITKDAELIVIDGKRFRSFAKTHSEIANILLGNIVINLTERLHHANNKLVTLYATGKIASTFSNFENLIDLLLKTILTTIHAKKAIFATYQPLENKIVIEQAMGYSNTGEIETLKLSISDDPILGEIHRTQRDIFVTKELYKEKPHLKTPYSAPSMLGVKIRTGGEIVGAILLVDKEGGENFSYNNQILLHIISRQIALAIQEAESSRERSLREENERVYIQPL